MTRRPKSAAVTKSDAPLPVPVDGAPGLPVTVDAQARLEADLKQAAKVLDGCDVPALRRLRRTLPHLRDYFARIDRPATAEEIVLGINDAIRTMSLAGNIDQEELANVLMAELAAEGATLFELATAVRAHRRDSQFLSVPKLLEELEHARRAAGRHRGVLAAKSAERIAEIEDYARRRARERRHKLAQYRDSLDELRSGGQLRYPIFRLPGIGNNIELGLLMEALDNDERDQQWAASFPPEREQLRHAAPDDWEPPDDEPPDDELVAKMLDGDELPDDENGEGE